MRIGIFDSGLGGLTILKSLLEKEPNHEYIYFGDTIHNPYGTKSKDEVLRYGNSIIKFLESEKVDVIIVACCTLSSNRELLKSNVQLIDVVSPLKNKLDNYQNVSIIATPLSVKTNAFQKYIKSKVNMIPCPTLVPIIENNEFDKLDDVLKEYLSYAKESDALVLGCTHYPLVSDYIKKYFQKDIISLDKYLLPKVNRLMKSTHSLKIYFSYLDDLIINNIKNILKYDNIDIERKCLND